jgi:hypothetical protein
MFANRMNADALERFRYLWDGSSPGWVLLKAPQLQGGYCVFHRRGQTLLHIESSKLNDAVCQKMREAGCEILDDVPRGISAVHPVAINPSVSAERNEISEAVTVYYGRDSEFFQPGAPFPQRLIDRFGSDKARNLERKIKLIVMALPSADEVMKCSDEMAVFNLAKAFLERNHPELDDQAVHDLSNEFSFWWK